MWRGRQKQQEPSEKTQYKDQNDKVKKRDKNFRDVAAKYQSI